MTNYLKSGRGFLPKWLLPMPLLLGWCYGRTIFAPSCFRTSPAERHLCRFGTGSAFISGAFVTDWNWTIGAVFTGASAVNFVFMLMERKAGPFGYFCFGGRYVGFGDHIYPRASGLMDRVLLVCSTPSCSPIFLPAVKDLKGAVGSASASSMP